MLKRIISHSLIYAVGPQVPKLVGFLLLPFITPYLSKSDFGIWGTIMAYSLLFTSARDLGMSMNLTNSYYKNPGKWKWVWKQIYFFLMAYGIGFTLIQLFVINFFLPNEVTFNNHAIILMFLGLQSLLFEVPIIVGSRYFQVNEKPVPISVIALISGTIAVIIQYYTVVNMHLGYMSWFYASFFSQLFSACTFATLLYLKNVYPLPILRMKWLKPRIKVAIPLLAHNYSAYLLNTSDRVIMRMYSISTTNIGLYNVAYMWGNYMDLIGGAIGTAVGPMYYTQFADNTSAGLYRLKIFNSLLQSGFIAGAFSIALWSKELFAIFIKNKELQGSYMLAIIIVMSYCYRPMYWLIINRLQFAEKTKQLLKITLMGGVMNIVLNAILMPIYGYKTAAYTTFFSLMYIGFSGFYLKAFKLLDKQNYNPMLWFLLIILFTIVAYTGQNLFWYYKLTLCVISILPLVYYVKKLSEISTKTI
ncbi:MAG: hypothetical protein EOP00_04710 [Pedobacter sp.]|nr:MAG: hypothetical protein EOP00_04710 [Pedobacter sp.]